MSNEKLQLRECRSDNLTTMNKLGKTSNKR